MHGMNDDKIKKIIQENVTKPEIKLSAAQILAMHEERKRAKEKPKRIPFFKRPTFKYKLYLDGDEKLNVEIKSYNTHGNGNGGRCAEVKTKYNNEDYEFYITKKSGNYVIEYLEMIIIATETEDKKFIYSYE